MVVAVVLSCFGLVLVAEAYSAVAPVPASPVNGGGVRGVSRVGGGLVGVLLRFLFFSLFGGRCVPLSSAVYFFSRFL